jgi:hypothetical protein
MSRTRKRLALCVVLTAWACGDQSQTRPQLTGPPPYRVYEDSSAPSEEFGMASAENGYAHAGVSGTSPTYTVAVDAVSGLSGMQAK